MKDYVIFLGEEVAKKFPDKTWEQCMEIIADTETFEHYMGPISEYHQKYMNQRRSINGSTDL